jgi:hypothetical protein
MWRRSFRRPVVVGDPHNFQPSQYAKVRLSIALEAQDLGPGLNNVGVLERPYDRGNGGFCMDPELSSSNVTHVSRNSVSCSTLNASGVVGSPQPAQAVHPKSLFLAHQLRPCCARKRRCNLPGQPGHGAPWSGPTADRGTRAVAAQQVPPDPRPRFHRGRSKTPRNWGQ